MLSDATRTETAGTAAARDALLRCWVRERAIAVPDDGELTVPLADGGTARTTVDYRSATGHHRFGPVTVAGRDVVDPAVLAAALVGTADGGADLVARVDDSTRRIERYLTHRRGTDCAPEADAFLGAEQDLLLGHLLHPAAKSRDGLSEAEDTAYAPELRGSFPLHWFAVDPAVLDTGAVADHPALAGRDLPGLMAELSGLDSDRPLIPAHPWQAADLMRRTGFRELVDAGAVRPLGPAGPAWYPTSSLRTVYRPGERVMLKLSLGLRITNSRRENTRTELARGIEVHRLLDSGADARVRARYPDFRVVRDPGYLAAIAPDGSPTHLDVSLREVPDGLTGALCLAGLVAPQPGVRPARIVSIVESLAARTGEAPAVVAARWVHRYVTRVLAPMVLLYATTGIGLEAHQQNTLVVPDADGWPATGWYRDNQGYYLAESALPGVLRRTGAQASTLALAPDAIVADRLTYYLLFNQTLAPVAALGGAGIARESDLLGAVRDALGELVATGVDTADGLVARWLHADTLPCKANLATRLAGIDEVLAPVDNQSVYLAVPNPLREAT